MLRRIEPGHVFGALLVALSGLAWVLLWIWQRVPAASQLHHHSFDAARDDPRRIPLLLAGWTVMVVAMMLPTQLGLIVTLQRNPGWVRPAVLGGLLIGVYLAVWMLYGMLVYLAGVLLQAVAAFTGLRRQAWAFGALSLIIAGVYQLTPAKRRLLHALDAHHRCNTDQRYLRASVAEAVVLGIRRGCCCVGCCWSLMLLMSGGGTFGWMLTLAAIMALEKNTAWQRRLVAPLGIALIVSGVLVMCIVRLEAYMVVAR